MQNCLQKSGIGHINEIFIIFLEDLLILASGLYVSLNLENSSLIWVPAGLMLLLNTLRIWYQKEIKDLLDLLIRYRYLIGAAALLFCILFRLHGSSIGVYDLLYGKTDPSIQSEIFGFPRPLRSDEFQVQTPYFFSQFYNNFNLISQQMSLSGQNMIIGYNSPVLDPTIIGKPFILGYLLFGNEIGLSWYWSSRWILFLLVGFEFFRILTEKKYFSAAASFCLVFASASQWWYTPHMYQVYFWATTLFVCGYKLFTAEGGLKKLGFSFLSISSATGFVTSIFPSLQVPCGLLMLFLMIACLFRDKKEVSWHPKDNYFILLIVTACCLILGNFILESKDALNILNNTVYPGHRISVGGDGKITTLILNPGLIFSPIVQPEYLNECEISSYYHFNLLFLAYFPYLWLKVRKSASLRRKMIPGFVLAALLLISLIFMYFGFPEWLAKITLFSYMNRMDLVYSFTGQIFTFWSVGVIISLHKKLSIWPGAVLSLLYFVLSLIVWIPGIDSEFLRFAGLWNIVLVLILMSLAVFSVFTPWSQIFIFFSICWALVTGLTVNPVVSGTASLTNHPLVQEALRIEEENPGLNWLSTDGAVTQELLLANGIRSINATNYYPDEEKWRRIDPSGEFDDFYNRYAHLIVTLSDQPTSFTEAFPDRIEMTMNVQDLKKWDIRRLVTTEDYYDLLTVQGLEPELLFYDEITHQSIFSLNY